METTARPGSVQLSSSAAALLSELRPPGLVLKPQGELAIKGKVRRGLLPPNRRHCAISRYGN